MDMSASFDNTTPTPAAGASAVRWRAAAVFLLSSAAGLLLIPGHALADPGQASGSAASAETARPSPTKRYAESLELARAQVHAVIDASTPPTWRCSPVQRRRLRYRRWRHKLKTRSIRAAEEEWRQRRLRPRLGPDLEHWQRVRWLYVLQRRVCDVGVFVRDGIAETTFAGETLKVHVRVLPRLREVEQRLAAMEQNVPLEFTYVGGFYPRTIRGPFGRRKRLSNHAMGMAIDIDPWLNPYFSRTDLRLIELISGVKIKRAAHIPAGERWDSFREAEEKFLAKVLGWIAEQVELIEVWERRARRSPAARKKLRVLETRLQKVIRGRNLARARSLGFLSLPRPLVVAMEEAGLSWSTDFRPGADLMHFELRR